MMGPSNSPFAFPHGEAIVGALRINPSPGMTLRDWFAGQALAGFCSISADEGEPLMGAADTAKAAFNYADAMLATREPPPSAPDSATKPLGPEWACEHGHADIFDCAECAPF